eukprot:scaffold72512_cov51-Phaeocystis_antarctica.AAC.3
MLVMPSGRLVRTREVHSQKARLPMLVRPSGADAGETVGQAGHREGGTAVEDTVADAGEAVRQAGQR